MAISIKTSEDIEKMRVAGRLAAEVLEMIEPYVKPGVSTGELDRICNDYIVNEQKAISACLGYHGFPKSVCISINEVVCHGIPDDGKLLKDGDIVNIDVTVIKDDFHGDTSKMFIVGKPTILGERLCRITQESLYLALKWSNRASTCALSARLSRNTSKRKVSPWCANTAATVSAAVSMKNRRCCTTTLRKPTWCSNPA
jgi:methionine aminopeptidase type I